MKPTKNSSAPAPVEPASGTLELEFSDWSGQVRPFASMTVEQMHRLSEALLPRATSRPDFDEGRLKAKVSAEFSL